MPTLKLRRRMATFVDGAESVGLLLSGWLMLLGAAVSRLAAWGMAWAETCADYHLAASLYEELRGRSDAALRSRCLNRATLAWEIAQTCDRTNGVPRPSHRRCLYQSA
jgi:hypothetical protein